MQLIVQDEADKLVREGGESGLGLRLGLALALALALELALGLALM